MTWAFGRETYWAVQLLLAMLCFSAPEAASEEVPAPRILVLGDSFAATDFGRALQRELGRQLVVRRRGKSATGLARPDYFDWTEEAKRLLKRHRPDLVIVILGGNDGQDLLGQGRRVEWGSSGWEAAYARRMDAFLDLLSGEGRRSVIWFELPRMARRGLERKLSVIRRVQAEVVHAHPDAFHFDSAPWFSDEGRPRNVVVLKGNPYPLRQEDGIHFTRPGAIWLARSVAPSLVGLTVDL